MTDAIQKGTPRADALKTPSPAEFKDFDRQQVYAATLGAIYDEVEAEAATAPDPAGPK